MIKSLFVLFFVLPVVFTLSSLTSCRSIPKAQPGYDLVLATAFVQKEIPGQQHMKITDYLTIQLNDYNQEQCTVDSVYYLNNKYLINPKQLELKILLEGGSVPKNNAFVSQQKEVATLFYHKQSEVFYLKINNIKRKEPLYLP